MFLCEIFLFNTFKTEAIDARIAEFESVEKTARERVAALEKSVMERMEQCTAQVKQAHAAANKWQQKAEKARKLYEVNPAFSMRFQSKHSS